MPCLALCLCLACLALCPVQVPERTSSPPTAAPAPTQQRPRPNITVGGLYACLLRRPSPSARLEWVAVGKAPPSAPGLGWWLLHGWEPVAWEVPCGCLSAWMRSGVSCMGGGLHG
eukprot:365072-Chlamydomonas_euryale.AAC.17